MASWWRKFLFTLPEPYQLRQWHDSDPFMTFFPDEEGLTARELADTFMSQTLDFQGSLDSFTTDFVLEFAQILARADEFMRQCQMANEEYPSENIVFTALLKKGDALWGELRQWLIDRHELLYLVDDMKLDSAPVVPIPVAWARELSEDRQTEDFGETFNRWIREVEEAFNDPNALKEICRTAPDHNAESEQVIKIKATKLKTARIRCRDRSAHTQRWAKTVIIQGSDSEATTVFDDESETHSDDTSKRFGVSSPADNARGRYRQILDEGTAGEFFKWGRALRTRDNGVTRQPRVPSVRPRSKSRAGTVEGWVEDATR